MTDTPVDLTGAPLPTDPPALPHWKDEALLGPAAVARQRPGEWAWVSSGPTQSGADVQWVREVVRGDRLALGGTAERWSAMAPSMVVRDGRWVLVERAGPLAEGEQPSVHRFIAYLGPRDGTAA